MDVNDFIRLQGFAIEDLPLASINVSESQLASALGDACSLNVVMMILPKALFLSNLITRRDYETLKRDMSFE